VSSEREEAQRAAEQELADPAYSADHPGPVGRAVRWLFDQFGHLLDRAAEVTPAGYAGLAVLVVLLALLVIVIRLRLGRIGRVTPRADDPLFDPRARSADEHRRAADGHAARGEWAEAVRERFRAVVRGLEERTLLDPRPGRTADEVATEGGRALPIHAAGLRAAARVFDDVWYGGRAATPEMDAQLHAVDEAVRATARARL
jgi:uncharacterized protein DUF4129